MKTCIICGKSFDARGKAKCCSPECSEENKREYQKKWKEENREYHREYHKKWYDENREYKREYDKKRYNENREYLLEYQKKWKEENREYKREYMKKWREENPEYKREYMKKWREENPEYQKEWYDENRDEVLEKSMQYKKNIISEFCEQYNGDLYPILENCPTSWQEREAKMRVWFGESYYDGMIDKIKSTPVCEVTGEKTNDLVIHHLYSFNTHPELGNDPANMVRVTKTVHKDFHKKYGYGNNTPEQWAEFVENL